MRGSNLALIGLLGALISTTACGRAAEPAPLAPATNASGAREEPASALADVAPAAAPPAGMQAMNAFPASPARAPAPGAAPAQPAPGAKNASTAAASAVSVSPSQPMVVYAAALQLRVEGERLAPSIDRAIDAAESCGGYLAGRTDSSVELRVPSSRFREAIAKLEGLGEVVHRSVTASDVSEEFHDAEVRLTNLRATRQRLQEFLAHAANVGEALKVELELERVAGEIDAIEGRMQFLKARAEYSQIAVALEATPKVTPRIAAAGAKKFVSLPVGWLDELGVSRLMALK